jgi:hypothetical protein
MAGGFVGAILLGAFYGALGCWLPRSRGAKWWLSSWGFSSVFLFLSGQAADYVPGLSGQLLAFLGVESHFAGFLKGVVDSRDIALFPFRDRSPWREHWPASIVGDGDDRSEGRENSD